jgi:general secretion pathway protein D
LLKALPLNRVVPGLNLLLGSEASPKLVIDALREVTKVKILSSPSLVVVNNQPAILQVGDQVPVTTRSAQDVTNPTAPVVNSIDFRDTGVILRVTPRVHANSTIGIDIEQEISSVKDTGDAATLTPTISQRRVKSTVAVADAQTLLIGGLISEQRNRGRSGIPGLVDVPVLGNIFSGTNVNENTRTELIIFIRPQLIHDMADARRVAESLRRRMKGFERW